MLASPEAGVKEYRSTDTDTSGVPHRLQRTWACAPWAPLAAADLLQLTRNASTARAQVPSWFWACGAFFPPKPNCSSWQAPTVATKLDPRIHFHT